MTTNKVLSLFFALVAMFATCAPVQAKMPKFHNPFHRNHKLQLNQQQQADQRVPGELSRQAHQGLDLTELKTFAPREGYHAQHPIGMYNAPEVATVLPFNHPPIDFGSLPDPECGKCEAVYTTTVSAPALMAKLANQPALAKALAHEAIIPLTVVSKPIIEANLATLTRMHDEEVFPHEGHLVNWETARRIAAEASLYDAHCIMCLAAVSDAINGGNFKAAHSMIEDLKNFNGPNKKAIRCAAKDFEKTLRKYELHAPDYMPPHIT